MMSLHGKVIMEKQRLFYLSRNICYSCNAVSFSAQVSWGLIFGRGSHIVWPPHRWGRLDSELLPGQRARVVQEQCS